MRQFLTNICVFLLIVITLQLIISLDWKIERDLETGIAQALKVRIPEPYNPEAEILAIQQYQVEHPELGFLWKPSITSADDVIVGWGDIPVGAIITDDIGFTNSENVVQSVRGDLTVDIIGLGASFMGGAQDVFTEYFALNGLSYYNLANSRFTLPQYNIALERYGLRLNPKWVVYGMNEASFTLIPDFEAWANSGMGWFEFHSGTWCGPAVKSGFPHDFLRNFPDIYNVYQSFLIKTFRGALEKKTSQRELINKTEAYIVDAWNTSRNNNIEFILILIPSKMRMLQRSSPSGIFDELIPRMKRKGVPFIDLREDFSMVEDPAMLYYREDAHWNRTGIYRAARQIANFIQNKESNENQF